MNRLAEEAAYFAAVDAGRESAEDELTTLRADLAAALERVKDLEEGLVDAKEERGISGGISFKALYDDVMVELEQFHTAHATLVKERDQYKRWADDAATARDHTLESFWRVCEERDQLKRDFDAWLSADKTAAEVLKIENVQLEMERDEALLRASIAHEQVEHWLDDGGCADCEVSKKAYRQGFEDCREVALKECRLFPASVRQIQAVNVVKLAIRALTVTERVEYE